MGGGPGLPFILADNLAILPPYHATFGNGITDFSGSSAYCGYWGDIFIAGAADPKFFNTDRIEEKRRCFAGQVGIDERPAHSKG